MVAAAAAAGALPASGTASGNHLDADSRDDRQRHRRHQSAESAAPPTTPVRIRELRSALRRRLIAARSVGVVGIERQNFLEAGDCRPVRGFELGARDRVVDAALDVAPPPGRPLPRAAAFRAPRRGSHGAAGNSPADRSLRNGRRLGQLPRAREHACAACSASVLRFAASSRSRSSARPAFVPNVSRDARSAASASGSSSRAM